MRLILSIFLLSLILLAGCTTTKYVCTDGSVVENQVECVKDSTALLDVYYGTWDTYEILAESEREFRDPVYLTGIPEDEINIVVEYVDLAEEITILFTDTKKFLKDNKKELAAADTNYEADITYIDLELLGVKSRLDRYIITIGFFTVHGPGESAFTINLKNRIESQKYNIDQLVNPEFADVLYPFAELLNAYDDFVWVNNRLIARFNEADGSDAGIKYLNEYEDSAALYSHILSQWLLYLEDNEQDLELAQTETVDMKPRILNELLTLRENVVLYKNRVEIIISQTTEYDPRLQEIHNEFVSDINTLDETTESFYR